MVKKKLELPRAKFIERIAIADDLAIFLRSNFLLLQGSMQRLGWRMENG